VGKEFGRAIEPRPLPFCYSDAELFGIPVNDDGRQQIEASNAEMLPFRGPASDFALSSNA
jgi:hypothetical protein